MDRKKKEVGNQSFKDALGDMWALYLKKNTDYGTIKDAFANFRASDEWGVPAWIGAMLRGSDKIKRLQSFVENGRLANEGVEDSLIDLANYAVIALVLFREAQSK
jgi:hypothetical protein